jgi:hypothetical protein
MFILHIIDHLGESGDTLRHLYDMGGGQHESKLEQ